MRKNHVRKLAILFIVLATTAVAVAQKNKPKTAAPAEPPLRGSNTKEGASQANKSAQVLKEIMGAPDKGFQPTC